MVLDYSHLWAGVQIPLAVGDHALAQLKALMERSPGPAESKFGML
ncbi:MAG: hypothetical protein V3T83_21585 [Acidobacteriota bacterium]